MTLLLYCEPKKTLTSEEYIIMNSLKIYFKGEKARTPEKIATNYSSPGQD